MKAAVYYGPNQVKIEEVPIPEISEDEYLLRVTVCGLCKTDLKKIRGVTLHSKGPLEPPRVFGHEIVGRIEKIGERIKTLGLKEGDRVVIYHHVPCLSCYYCLRGDFAQCETYRSIDTTCGVGAPSGGGFAQYIKVPWLVAERGTVKIPEHVDDKIAVFTEPTNCCLKGIRKANINLGDYVAIFGQGPIGLTLDQLASLQGGQVIPVDLVDYRLQKAKELCEPVDIVKAQDENFIGKIKEITSGRGVDVSIVAVESAKAVEQAIKCTRGGGRVVFFSEFGESTEPYHLGDLIDLIYSKEITIYGCYSSSYPDHQLAAELVFEKKIKVEEMISHIFDLDHLMEGIELADKRRHLSWEGEKLADRPKESFKILFTP